MSENVMTQDLELESAELLPARETLCCTSKSHSGGSIFAQVGYGHAAQSGLANVSVGNGFFDNFLTLASGNVG